MLCLFFPHFLPFILLFLAILEEWYYADFFYAKSYTENCYKALEKKIIYKFQVCRMCFFLVFFWTLRSIYVLLPINLVFFLNNKIAQREWHQ